MARPRSPLAYLGNTGDEFKPKPLDAFFPLSGDGGDGIPEAAGLSTLGKVYEGFLSDNDWVEDTSIGIDRAKTFTENAMLDAWGDYMKAEARNKYMAEAQKIREGYEQEVEKKNTQTDWLKTGAQIVSTAAPFVLGALSDERTKHTIDELEDALGLLRQLKPVTFYYKDEYSAQPERMHYGFIAQEYQKVMPDATYKDESIDKLCIDPIELIGVLVRAVQQLETKVTRLEVKQVMSGVK
jgi:hypothetical protein